MPYLRYITNNKPYYAKKPQTNPNTRLLSGILQSSTALHLLNHSRLPYKNILKFNKTSY